MTDRKVLSEKTYPEVLKGISMASDRMVFITGEQTVQLEDGRVIDQYVYDIEGVEPENKQPFVALKANIILLK